MVKIAAAYDNGQIASHFGHCKQFAIYEYGEIVTDCKKTIVDTSNRNGHEEMVSFMIENEVKAVICSKMGQAAFELLAANSILPVLGYAGDADLIANLLITGQLTVKGTEEANCGCGGNCGEGCTCGKCGGSCSSWINEDVLSE